MIWGIIASLPQTSSDAATEPTNSVILYLEEGASVTLETVQIKGVDDTKRYTKAVLGKDAEIIIQEKLLTHGQQHAVSEMDVFLNEAGSKTRVISRSVAQDDSSQIFYPRVEGNAPCFGHVQCDAIIMGSSKVRALPEITCTHVDASLIHEAAIGKIAGEQILKLMTLGLTAEEAEEQILEPSPTALSSPAEKEYSISSSRAPLLR